MTVETSNWRVEQRQRGADLRKRLRVEDVLQRDVAAHLGIDESLLSRYLRGLRRWDEDFEERFDAALKAAQS